MPGCWVTGGPGATTGGLWLSVLPGDGKGNHKGLFCVVGTGTGSPATLGVGREGGLASEAVILPFAGWLKTHFLFSPQIPNLSQAASNCPSVLSIPILQALFLPFSKTNSPAILETLRAGHRQLRAAVQYWRVSRSQGPPSVGSLIGTCRAVPTQCEHCSLPQDL